MGVGLARREAEVPVRQIDVDTASVARALARIRALLRADAARSVAPRDLVTRGAGAVGVGETRDVEAVRAAGRGRENEEEQRAHQSGGVIGPASGGGRGGGGG